MKKEQTKEDNVMILCSMAEEEPWFFQRENEEETLLV